MADGYSRQSAAAIATGNTILASDVEAEFDQTEKAFHATTGHDHTGGAALGPKLSLTAAVSGTLPVANGGTGATTLTDGGVLLGSGTGAITAMGVLADGEVIVGDGTTDPVAESGATLRTSIGVGTGDSPQFTGIELGHATDTTVTRASAGDLNIEGNLVYRVGGTDVSVADGGTGASTLTDGGVLLGSGTGAITAMDALADGSIIVGDGTTDPVALAAFTSSTGTLKHESGGIEANISAVTTNDFLVGTGAGTIGIENAATARASMGAAASGANSDITSLTGLTTDLTVAQGGTGAGTHTDGGILFGKGTSAISSTAALGDGTIVIGDGVTDPVTLAAFTSSTGTLKHESGGLEFNASAVADGDIVVGTGTGTMALRVGALTAGAAGFLKHEVGGLEFDLSAITTNDFLVGSSAGVVGIESGATARTSLGVAIGTDVLAQGDTSIGKHAIPVPSTAMYSATTNGAEVGSSETSVNAVMIKTFDFDKDTDEYVQFQIPMPSSWDEGTVTAKFYWSHPATATNFGVSWAIQGLSLGNSDALDSAFGTAIVVDDTGGTTDDIFVSDESAAVTISGTPAASDIVIFRIFRDVSDANDDLAVDARLHSITLFITTDAAVDV